MFLFVSIVLIVFRALCFALLAFHFKYVRNVVVRINIFETPRNLHTSKNLKNNL